MNINLITTRSLVLSASFLVSACSVAQLEARLEANPQCKEIVNPKTGSLMPCPGSDKSFYREVGLAPAKIPPVATTVSSQGTGSAIQKSTNGAASIEGSPTKTTPLQSDCKPQIHKKTGGTLPCPAPD